jgi:leucyl-tRNA synthetase
MEFINTLTKAKDALHGTEAWNEATRTLILLLAPPCPHITEELWERIGGPYSVHQQSWPRWDAEVAREEIIELPVLVNGKVRDRITVPVDVTEEQAREAAFATEGFKRHTEGKQVVKVIYAPGRLVNVVVK